MQADIQGFLPEDLRELPSGIYSPKHVHNSVGHKQHMEPVSPK